MFLIVIGVSLPMPRPYKYLKEELLKKIKRGEILIGELIEPKCYIRIKFKKGKIVKEKVEIHGRKLPLEEIRKRIFEEHKSLGNFPLRNAVAGNWE